MIKKNLFTFAAVITLTLGMGLTASAQETADTFDYKAYADTYPDLKAAYGYDANALFAHYINFGKAEGRVGNFAGVAAAPTNGGSATTPATSPSFSINTISIGGDTYTLPCPVSQFLNNGWIIDKLHEIGCDTAKSVLEMSAETLATRADLEIEHAEQIIGILKAEFEEEQFATPKAKGQGPCG